MNQKDSIPKVQKRFNAIVQKPELFLQSDEINGFSHPNVPVILDKSPQNIETTYSWGLLPHWAKDDSFRKNTLNARIETVFEKPTFKDVVNQRCIMIGTGFYEWHWLDDKGKSKQKYSIYGEEEIIAFAGLYSHWTNPQTGVRMSTVSMLTTKANATMDYIHNHKKRMPIILKKADELAWLSHELPFEAIAFPYQTNLIAF